MPEPDPTLVAVTNELAQLRAQVDAQETLLADLQRAPDAPLSRRHLLRGLATVGVAGAAGVASAESASADTGDNLILGQANVASTTTTLTGGTEGTPNLDLVSQTGIALRVQAATYGILASGAIGVLGETNGEGNGVQGVAWGATGHGIEGLGRADGAIGVVADSYTGPALGAASLDGVALELRPATRTGPPTAAAPGLTEYRTGAFSVDEVGDLWLCVETGNPGVWTRLMREDTAAGKVIPIDPFRALDTRSPGGQPVGSPTIPGQMQGPLNGGEVISLDLAGHGPLPDDITGVLGNVTVVSSSFAGYLQLYPQGTAPPSTSAVNFASGATVANAFTTRVGVGGLSAVSPGSASRTYHLVVDITAFVS